MNKSNLLVAALMANKEILNLIEKALEIDDDIEIGGLIFKTKKADNFNKVTGNRNIDFKHAASLKKGIAKEGFNVGQPIVIDKDLSILDGQHRAEACSLLQQDGKDVELYFTIQETNDSFKKVIEMQTKRKNWKIEDFIHSYAEKGNENYIKLEEFKINPLCNKITASSLIRLFNNSRSESTTKRIKEGKFIYSETKAAEIINLLEQINAIDRALSKKEQDDTINKLRKLIYTEVFICAFKIVSREEGYDNATFINRLTTRQTSIHRETLKNCESVKDIGRSIVSIFNYSLPDEKRISNYDLLCDLLTYNEPDTTEEAE